MFGLQLPSLVEEHEEHPPPYEQAGSLTRELYSLVPTPFLANCVRAARQQHTSTLPFTPFKKLPPELRLKIWGYAFEMKDGAVIYFRYRTYKRVWHIQNQAVTNPVGERQKGTEPAGVHSAAYPIQEEYIVTASRNNPALLSVNQESRLQVLKKYQLVFGNKLLNQPIYIDFYKDTLFFLNQTSFRKFFVNPVFAKYAASNIQHLAIAGKLSFNTLERFWKLKPLALENDSTFPSSAHTTWPAARDLEVTRSGFLRIWRKEARLPELNWDNLPEITLLTNDGIKAKTGIEHIGQWAGNTHAMW